MSHQGHGPGCACEHLRRVMPGVDEPGKLVTLALAEAERRTGMGTGQLVLAVGSDRTAEGPWVERCIGRLLTETAHRAGIAPWELSVGGAVGAPEHAALCALSVDAVRAVFRGTPEGEGVANGLAMKLPPGCARVLLLSGKGTRLRYALLAFMPERDAAPSDRWLHRGSPTGRGAPEAAAPTPPPVSDEQGFVDGLDPSLRGRLVRGGSA